MEEKYKQQFLDIINQLGTQLGTSRVFSDAVTISSLSLQNVVYPTQAVEDEYARLIKPYTQKQFEMISKLLTLIVLALNDHPHDFLGEIYMALKISNETTGQFYTPFHICELMVALADEHDFDQQPTHIVTDPACGSGAMFIAHFAHMVKMGRNPQRECWYMGQDICFLSANMCYVQMSVLGMPGRVAIGDSLSNQPPHHILLTPMHHIEAWGLKLQNRHLDAEATMKTGAESECKKSTAKPSETECIKEKSVTEMIQASLF